MNKRTAQIKLRIKIENGEINRPVVCELCGNTPIKYDYIFAQVPIVAHHWRGYDYPLDVWWLCHSCHSRLRTPFFHTGAINKEQAKRIVHGPLWKRYRPDVPQDVAIITNGNIKVTIINHRRKDWSPTPASYARILRLTKRAWVQFPWWRDGWQAYLIDIDVL